jgi:hypothetical protein
MVVGLLQMQLAIREAHSLKDKRRVLRSLKDRIRNTFNVSVAEVDDQDRRQQAVLGVALVTNDRTRADAVLSKVVALVRRTPGAELVDYETELL